MSGSLLDMLRQRTASAMQDEALRRASEFGAGMLASGSPNFFTMLGAGARAQAEGERSRTDELRRLADLERQQRALESQEAAQRGEADYRQESLRLRRLEAERAGRPAFQFMAGPTPGTVVAIDPRDPTRIIPVPGARLATDRSSREEVALRQNARNTATTDVARMEAAIVNAGGRVTPEQRAQFLRDAEERALASVGLLPLPGASTSQQQQPAPGGRPVQRETFIPPEQRR